MHACGLCFVLSCGIYNLHVCKYVALLLCNLIVRFMIQIHIFNLSVVTIISYGYKSWGKESIWYANDRKWSQIQWKNIIHDIEIGIYYPEKSGLRVMNVSYGKFSMNMKGLQDLINAATNCRSGNYPECNSGRRGTGVRQRKCVICKCRNVATGTRRYNEVQGNRAAVLVLWPQLNTITYLTTSPPPPALMNTTMSYVVCIVWVYLPKQ